MTETARSVAERTYAALRARDLPALSGLLAEDVRADMTAGLPFGTGGAHHGRDALFGEVWGTVAEHLDGGPGP